METLDVWEPNSALQPQAVSWASYPLDGYDPMLEEGASDSETSMDSRQHALYFENCDVKLENPSYEAGIGGYAPVGVMPTDTMGWSYTGDGSLSSVMSPTSESDDTMRYGVSSAMNESGDETSPSYDDPSSSSEEDMMLNNDGSGEEYEDDHQAAVKEENDSPIIAQPKLGANGRPMRSSARGDQMKQVQEMIRQVNSAVEATGPAHHHGGPSKGGNRGPASSASHSPSSSSGSPSSGSSNSKKRARVEPDLRSVTLTREQLLTMTSEELDVFTERLKADHTLTPHELRELKRQRRLIKNREYAQASRVKKKVVLSDLGSKFSDLENERNTLAMRVQALEIENTELRRQLGLDPSKRNLNQFIIGGSSSMGSNGVAPSASANPFSPHRGAGAQPKQFFQGSTGPRTEYEESIIASHSSNAADNDYMFQPPKAKRTKGRQNTPSVPATFSSRAAVIGGGMSLFAVVLLAVAVFSGVGTPFFATPISGGSPISNYPMAGQQQQNQPMDTGYNTFRTMDILATSPEDIPDPSLDPTSIPINTLTHQGKDIHETLNKQEEELLTQAPASTIVTMDELLAAEEMIYTTTNASLPEETLQHDEQMQQQQQQA